MPYQTAKRVPLPLGVFEFDLPTEKNASIEDLERTCKQVSKLNQAVKSTPYKPTKNMPIQSEKQLEMRIRLRKKLEKKKGKKK